jgi:hypothetical protein
MNFFFLPPLPGEGRGGGAAAHIPAPIPTFPREGKEEQP